MYKYCPHCGKPFLEPDKPRTVGIISQVKEFITWAQIKEWSDLREASKHFEIGDEIHDELKTGEPITLVVVEKDKPFDGDVMFMLKDCLRDTYPMNDDCTNAGGWKASKLRKVLNTEILALLPDDMRAAIKPRVIDGESDLLWLASEMEVFGPHDWTENDPDRGEQMAYYKRRGNRVKALGDEGEAAYTCWVVLLMRAALPPSVLSTAAATPPTTAPAARMAWPSASVFNLRSKNPQPVRAGDK